MSLETTMTWFVAPPERKRLLPGGAPRGATNSKQARTNRHRPEHAHAACPMRVMIFILGMQHRGNRSAANAPNGDVGSPTSHANGRRYMGASAHAATNRPFMASAHSSGATSVGRPISGCPARTSLSTPATSIGVKACRKQLGRNFRAAGISISAVHHLRTRPGRLRDLAPVKLLSGWFQPATIHPRNQFGCGSRVGLSMASPGVRPFSGKTQAVNNQRPSSKHHPG